MLGEANRSNKVILARYDDHQKPADPASFGLITWGKAERRSAITDQSMSVPHAKDCRSLINKSISSAKYVVSGSKLSTEPVDPESDYG
jgi:hypothetical protein